MSYAIDGKMGVKLDQVDTSAAHVVGTRVCGNENSEWMYIQAGSAVSQYNAVMIDQSSKAYPITTTNAASSTRIGFAQTSIASAKYGWVALQGTNISVSLAANCAPNVRLYTTGTGGVLDDAIVSAGLVEGVKATVTISNATAVRVIAVNPHVTDQSTT